MKKEEILEQVVVIFRRVLKEDSLILNYDTTADDVEKWDSLNHTILMGDIQKHFNVRFKLKEILKFRNVGDICSLLEERL